MTFCLFMVKSFYLSSDCHNCLSLTEMREGEIDG